MIIGYLRVSTGKQHLENQQDEINRYARENNMMVDRWVMEVVSGKTEVRGRKLGRTISRMTKGDTLIVCKLDRFARTASDGVNLIKELLARGVSVHVLNMGLVENTPTGRLILTIMMAFAEYERDMIIERLNDGKVEAKAKNPDYREGRKTLEIPTQFETYRTSVANGRMSVVAACRELGISRTLWYKWTKNSCRA